MTASKYVPAEQRQRSVNGPWALAGAAEASIRPEAADEAAMAPAGV